MAGRIKLRKNDQRLVLAVGALTGVTLASQGLHPTGQRVIDWILVVVATTAAVWACATTPWWALVTLAAVAAALAPPVGALVIGIGVVALALAVGLRQRSQPVERAVAAGAAILVLSLAHEVAAWGVNSAIAITVTLGVAILGVTRRPRRERRIAWYSLAAAGAVVVLGGAGLALAGLSARDDLEVGNDIARSGLRQLKDGDFDAAQITFAEAAARFERSADALGAPWAQVSRLVPIAAQHRNAGADLTAAAADATRTIETQLRRIDFDALKVVNGRIDVDAVRGLQQPMAELQAALDDLDAAVDSADNGWLVGAVRDRLHDLDVEIAEQQVLSDKANQALEVAPSLLGADGPRTYFVMFTTPAEARGQGGFMGNYAELTVDNGNIAMTAFGTVHDLEDAGGPGRTITRVDKQWLDRYGQYGFTDGPNGTVGKDAWLMLGLSPDFPSNARVAAELYEQGEGGRPVDGVISLDVYAMEALVGLVGPLEVEGAPELTGSNTAEFLLLDQYLSLDDSVNPRDANLARRDMLAQVAEQTITRLLETAPPDPIDLGKALAPLARDSRIYAWSPIEAEQELFETIDIDGALLDDDLLNGGDGFMVTVNNFGGSKIDSFLERSITYHPDLGEIHVTLTNTAPPDGLPPYVIGVGGGIDVPMGTSILWLTLHSTVPIEGASLGGEQLPITPTLEAGHFAYSTRLRIGSREAVTVVFELAGGGADMAAQEQPLAS